MVLKKEVLLPDELGRGFSRAIRVGGVIYVAGVTGRFDLKTWREDPRAKGDIKLQARRAFEWLEMVLRKCDSSMENVFRLNIYLTQFDALDQVFEVYQQFFTSNPPVVNALGIARLVGIAELEIDAEALA